MQRWRGYRFSPRHGLPRQRLTAAPTADPLDRKLLEILGEQGPSNLEQLERVTGAPRHRLLGALGRLESAGQVTAIHPSGFPVIDGQVWTVAD